MSFMQIKSEVHAVADMACHQIQSVEMKSIQAYGICEIWGKSFLLCVNF